MTSDYTGNRAIAATGNRKQSISTSVVRDILDGNLSLQPLRGTTNAQIAYVSGRFITRFYVKYNMPPPPAREETFLPWQKEKQTYGVPFA